MAYPHWVYRDPSENVDFLREVKEKIEAREHKRVNTKEELEVLLSNKNDGEKPNE